MDEKLQRTHVPFNRREFITALGATGLALPWLGRSAFAAPYEDNPSKTLRVPDKSPLDLYIRRTELRIDGRHTKSAVTINGTIPGPTLVMREGQDVEIRVHNEMDEDTSLHWHGIILPTDMDGVPGVSYAGIKPGEIFTYKFRVRQSGTYWYHSHTGLQEQLGHFGALIVLPRSDETVEFDRDYPIVLSDWMFDNPYTALKKLKKFSGYYNYQRPTIANLLTESPGGAIGQQLRNRLRWDAMRMDPTDIADITGVVYTYLMNGRSSEENWTARANPGERVRLRLINAATMTYFDFRIPGLPMTVISADGQCIKPVETDEIRIAVAETYDVIVQMPDDSAYTMYAETMDRSGFVRGTLATKPGKAAPLPPRRARPMRTMADMGMAPMAGMGMAPMLDKPMNGMSADMESAGTESMTRGDTKPSSGDVHSPEPHIPAETTRVAGGMIPTSNLPESIAHGPNRHGINSSMVAMRPSRRYKEPGIGLGEDGWRVLTYNDLRAPNSPEDRRVPDREIDLHLTGNMERYIWGFDGKRFSESDPIRFVYGERLRLNMINDTMMDHPIHLHGMWMDLCAGGTLFDNPRKHTVSVKPGELLTVDISVDAPGRWAFHCHLLYHMDMGMFRTIAVVRSLEEVVIR